MAIGSHRAPHSGDTERHVLIIGTGGTICMQDSPNGLIPTRNFAKNCLEPSIDFNDGTCHEETQVFNEYGVAATATTFRATSGRPSTASFKYSVFEFDDLIDSSSMDGGHWNLILECLRLNWDSFDAFVVLHGTDTLAYTASMLAFMLGDLDKTVIVTGSQLSMYAPHNDAHDNLLDSLTVAALYDVLEVGVVFHHHLYRGTRVTKVSAFSMAAFTTPNAKALASFPKRTGHPWTALLHLDKIVPASSSQTNRARKKMMGDPVRNLDTSRVAVLKVYPGMSSGLISSIVQMPNLGGLILETFGAGNIPIGTGGKDLLQILATAVKMGIVVVSVTQCLTGSVTSSYESARRMEREGIVTGLDMTTEAAYTKLAYLLAVPNMSHSQIAMTMRQNLRGELTADYREEQKTQDSVAYMNA